MGLRKRPYSDDKKGGDKTPKKMVKPGGGSNKGGFKSTPAKRSYKKNNEGFDKKPNRFSNDNENKRTLSKSTGRSKKEEGGYEKRPTRFSGEGDKRAPAKRGAGFNKRNEEGSSGPQDRRYPLKRAAGFKRDEGGYEKRPTRFSGEGGRRTPVKRAGGFKRNEDGYDKPGRFSKDRKEGFNDRKPRGRAFDDNQGSDKKPRISKTGKPYMVRGAKARDTKAKSDEMLETLIPDEIRLNRYISNAGICSRREADDLIAAGLVAVNGDIVTEMGYKVKPGDEVRYNNERLGWEKKVYLIMNKPKDTITTSDDPDGRKIIMDLIDDPRLPRIYPVGRLDRNTTGVILLTNDGELAQRLTHPKYNITKVYKAVLNKNFAPKDMQELASNGVELEDGPIKPDVIGMPDPREKNGIMVQIHSGRNRIIHRMFEALGYLVDKLDRLDFAGFEKKGMERGAWRHLDEKEIKKLKKLVQLK